MDDNVHGALAWTELCFTWDDWQVIFARYLSKQFQLDQEVDTDDMKNQRITRDFTPLAG